ncbi:MAG: hypothetical protein ACJ8F3_20915 [Xanthobacteraceae bacterium]
MPYLTQILLPLYDNEGRRFSSEHYSEVHSELMHRFGGLTAYTRAPAEGSWKTGSVHKRDDIVIVEIMTETLDRDWWRRYREKLETVFRQDEIVIRAQSYEPL